MGGLGLAWDLRTVWGGEKREAGLRRVAGAILVLVDQTLVVGFSSSAEEGGGRSPYSPPSIWNQIQWYHNTTQHFLTTLNTTATATATATHVDG